MPKSHEAQTAVNTPRAERTHRQWRLTFDLLWRRQKEESHAHNKEIFTGRRPASTGLAWFEKGHIRGKTKRYGRR